MPLVKDFPTHIKDFDKDPLESELIYWDTNFAVKLLVENQSYSSQCISFLKRLKKRQPVIIFSELLLIELWTALLKIKLQNIENTKSIDLRKICRKRPNIIANLSPKIEGDLRKFKGILSNFTDWLAIPVSRNIINKAFKISKEYNLISYDAIHISTMLYNDIYPIKNIVTFDWQIEDITDINVWTKNGIRKYCERHNIPYT